MNVTETSAEGLKREFKITVPASEVEEEITKRLGEIGRVVRIPGFRPGKVPLPLLRKRYGPAVRGEVLEKRGAGQLGRGDARAQSAPGDAAAGRADLGRRGRRFRIQDVAGSAARHAGARFRLARAGKAGPELPDEDIDKALERLAEQQRKTEPVERPAETGDILVADMVGHVGETEIPGSRGEDRQIELGAEGLLPGFTEQLLGAAAGDKREVRVTFPADYGNPDMAGKEGVFEVTVKQVLHRLPAAIDDTLAEAVGLENLNELRQEIRQRMQRDYEGIARQRLKRMLLDKLAEGHDFPVPPGMVEMEFNSIWAQYEGEKEARKQIAARRRRRPGAARGRSTRRR